MVRLGAPAVLIPGLVLAMVLGWNAKELWQIRNFYENEAIFPKSGLAGEAIDGDNFYLNNDQSIRLIGTNAPDRGETDFEKAKNTLNSLVGGKKVYLEYDRYQDDKYGRIMAWVWVSCETKPNFLPADYMRLSFNRSRPGLKDNPDGCKQGKLVNEAMIRVGLAEVETYKDRGELKYEARLRN